MEVRTGLLSDAHRRQRIFPRHRPTGQVRVAVLDKPCRIQRQAIVCAAFRENERVSGPVKAPEGLNRTARPAKDRCRGRTLVQ